MYICVCVCACVCMYVYTHIHVHQKRQKRNQHVLVNCNITQKREMYEHRRDNKISMERRHINKKQTCSCIPQYASHKRDIMHTNREEIIQYQYRRGI